MLKALIAENEDLHARRSVIDQRLGVVVHEIKEIVRREMQDIPGIYAIPCVYFSNTFLSVSGMSLGLYSDFQIMEGGGWGERDLDDVYGYGVPCEGPMPWEEFDAKVQVLGRKLGIKVEYTTLKLRTVGGVESFAAVQVAHPDVHCQLIERGQNWYEGWDISNKYFVCSIANDVWAFWSVGQHGLPISESAKLGSPEWENFEQWKKDGSLGDKAELSGRENT